MWATCRFAKMMQMKAMIMHPAADHSDNAIFAKVCRDFNAVVRMPVPKVEYCGQATLNRYLQAVAAASAKLQENSARHILNYLLAKEQAGSVSLVAVIQHCLYDETPLRTKVLFLDEPDLQLAKTVSVEMRYAFLFRELPIDSKSAGQFVFVHGCYSPSVRATDKTTGEALGGVLQSVWKPWPGMDRFPMHIRMVETDQAGANNRCEALLRGLWPRSAELQLHCACHRIHAAMDKTIKLKPKVLSGIIRSGLVMRQAGVAAAFKRVLRSVPLKVVRFSVLPPLPPDAQSFKDTAIKFFSPASGRGRILLETLSNTLFNADWRETGAVIHRCGPGCCKDVAESEPENAQVVGKTDEVLAHLYIVPGELAMLACGVTLAWHLPSATLLATLFVAKSNLQGRLRRGSARR